MIDVLVFAGINAVVFFAGYAFGHRRRPRQPAMIVFPDPDRHPEAER